MSLPCATTTFPQSASSSQCVETSAMTRIVLVCVAVAALVLGAWGRINPGPDSCPPGTRYCEQDEQPRCLHLEFWCDGAVDCYEKFDEKNCSECSPRGFHCDGKCERGVYRCDGYVDCKDGADEIGCDGIPVEQVFTCGDGTRRRTVLCDGWMDCPNLEYTDEEDCTEIWCQGGALWCDDTCVPASYNCDGWKYCEDGRDEVYCPDNFTYTTPTMINASAPIAIPAPGERAELLYVLSAVSGVLVGAVAALACGVWLRSRHNSNAPPQVLEDAAPADGQQDACLGPPGAPGSPEPTPPSTSRRPGDEPIYAEPMENLHKPVYVSSLPRPRPTDDLNYDLLDFPLQTAQP